MLRVHINVNPVHHSFLVMIMHACISGIKRILSVSQHTESAQVHTCTYTYMWSTTNIILLSLSTISHIYYKYKPLLCLATIWATWQLVLCDESANFQVDPCEITQSTNPHIKLCELMPSHMQSKRSEYANNVPLSLSLSLSLSLTWCWAGLFAESPSQRGQRNWVSSHHLR